MGQFYDEPDDGPGYRCERVRKLTRKVAIASTPTEPPRAGLIELLQNRAALVQAGREMMPPPPRRWWQRLRDWWVRQENAAVESWRTDRGK